MKLKTVRTQNYKSIEDSNEFSIESVTCLVGKNESGKSALLQALYKLNPVVKEDGLFDAVEEYPRARLSDYQEALEADPSRKQDNVITTTWELEEAELKAFAEAFGPKALKDPHVEISKGYDNTQYWSIAYDEASVIAYLLTSTDLHEEELVPLRKAKTVTELLSMLQSVTEPSPRQTALLSLLNSKFLKKKLINAAIDLLDEFLPLFVYFPEYEKMPGRVSIDDLLRRKQAAGIQIRDHIFLALLDLVGTTPEQLTSITKLEPLIAKLEAVSLRITREIFAYWSQNRYLEVEFRLDAARPNDPPPFNTGYIFQTRIENKRHGVTVSFDERSTGFVWFFSFLVWFSQLQKNYGKRLFILLDEPGLSLHGKAQGDLLRYINEKLKPQYQVIYSTHSPFMVDATNLLSARTVEDVVTKDEEVLGTKVGDKVLSTDADTVFPLQAALGYDITQSLFVGKDCLLVEGPSDLLYLKWFSQELQARKRTHLDPRWVITPVGGVDKVGAFLALFGGNKLHVAVLTDFQQGEKKKVRELGDSNLLKQGHVFTADMYANQPEADVEDMLGRSTYVELVNECYELKGQNKLPKPKAAATGRVVKDVEDHFRTLPASVSEFDHFAPASYLVEHTSALKTSLPNLDEALDRFEALFKDLNSLLPS